MNTITTKKKLDYFVGRHLLKDISKDTRTYVKENQHELNWLSINLENNPINLKSLKIQYLELKTKYQELNQVLSQKKKQNKDTRTKYPYLHKKIIPQLNFEIQIGNEGRPFRLSASKKIEKGMAHTFKYLDELNDYFTLFMDKFNHPYQKLDNHNTKLFLNNDL